MMNMRLPDVAIELTFFDARTGDLVEGVQLDVESPDGFKLYFQPVNDYMPQSRPGSDEAGTVVFHTIDHRYGAVVTSSPFRSPSLPRRYHCRFRLRGVEVYHVTLEELVAEARSDRVSEKRRLLIPDPERVRPWRDDVEDVPLIEWRGRCLVLRREIGLSL